MEPTRAVPTVTNPQLAKAFAHPVRVQIMAILTERVASPKELAEEIGESIKNISYHIEVLVRLNCIELKSAEAAGGGRVVEHFYRALQRPYIDAAAWERLNERQKYGVTGTIMRLVSEDIADAMEKGTFNDPDDNHISRTPMVVDKEGWDEVAAHLDRSAEGLLDIQAKVAGRLGSGEQPTMPIKVEIIHFRSPKRG
jgi:DNA-binding transcriptional ArsR family regulator